MTIVLRLALCALLTGAAWGGALANTIHQYVFFGRERERIRESTFLQTRVIEGAQLKYMWRELEPEEGNYDFSEIRRDLRFLKAHRKKLFIQLQDATFTPGYYGVPAYLRSDPRYHGGVAPQYSIPGGNDDHPVLEGWVARRWDPAVRARFQRLLKALGKQFDGKIEGVNLAETSVDFGASGRLYPEGFTPKLYLEAVIANMRALKRAFPRSVTMQYANFMPGEWLPSDDHSYLRTVYRQAVQLGVGVGGPDLLPLRPGQMHHCYPLLREYSGRIPTGIAVQDGNYEEKNPQTGRRFTETQLLRFAQKYLEVDYIFWGTQEPYYSQELLPLLRTFSNGARTTNTPSFSTIEGSVTGSLSALRASRMRRLLSGGSCITSAITCSFVSITDAIVATSYLLSGFYHRLPDDLLG